MGDKLKQALELIREAQLEADPNKDHYGKLDDMIYQIEAIIEETV